MVEAKRPPMYTAMKYWGKKPHNIWGAYIESYTSENDVVLDPFSGSAVAAFEAVRCGRKAIAFDLNPMTAFLIDVYSTRFDRDQFAAAVGKIAGRVREDADYREIYLTKCDACGSAAAVIQHTKWDGGKIYEAGIACPRCKKRYLSAPNQRLEACAVKAQDLHIPYWYPADPFYDSPSFSESFKRNIGGDSFDRIWTRRNLFVLSKIFNEILSEQDRDLKLQLLFGFVQTVHLSSKMCVPRRAGANLGFSTSWGRAAYICSKRQMEMNPLLLFESSCIGKQSVESALKSVASHVGKVPKAKRVSGPGDAGAMGGYDILYGTVDVRDIERFIPRGTIPFIITDPPYGGLVQYIDLSCIWLNWLKRYDPVYTPSADREITIKKGIKGIEDYCRDFTDGLRSLYNVLKPDGKIVFTFHNKDLMVWNAFLRSVSQAGFRIEKVIHQQNRRTGESNVANPYGTSASDFYIRCSKSAYVGKIRTTKEAFENFIVDRAVSMIQARNEPTPYQMLFNGLLSEISKAGFELENFDDNIRQLLEKHTGDVFEIEKTDRNFGDLWWLKNYDPASSPVVPLAQRVEQTICEMFLQRTSYSLDDILGQIFIKFPDGLTPDVRNLEEIIQKYAEKSGGKWVRKEGARWKENTTAATT